MLTSNNNEVFVVYDGKIVTPEAIGRLKDHVIVQVVDKLTGGGKKKNQRKSNQTQSDQSGSSSSEADVFYELMEKNFGTGEGGIDNFFQALLKMDDEMIQKMMDKLRHILEVDKGRDPTPAFEAMKRMVQEHRTATKTQHEKAAPETQRRRRQEDITRFKEEQRQVLAEKEEAAKER